MTVGPPHFSLKNMDNPSVHESNKVARVLSGKPLKYTVRVHNPDGSVVEFQAALKPNLGFFVEDRSLWLMGSDYGTNPIMKWVDGSILLVEENPS